MATRWVALADLRAEIAARPEVFTPWLADLPRRGTPGGCPRLRRLTVAERDLARLLAGLDPRLDPDDLGSS